MEGPIDFPSALSICVEPAHQLISTTSRPATSSSSRQVPTIMNSPVWQDPTQKSAIFLTFDEDYNNLSLGFGNQGNHVVVDRHPVTGRRRRWDAPRPLRCQRPLQPLQPAAHHRRRPSDFPRSPTMTNSPNPLTNSGHNERAPSRGPDPVRHKRIRAKRHERIRSTDHLILRVNLNGRFARKGDGALARSCRRCR